MERKWIGANNTLWVLFLAFSIRPTVQNITGYCKARVDTKGISKEERKAVFYQCTIADHPGLEPTTPLMKRIENLVPNSHHTISLITRPAHSWAERWPQLSHGLQ